MTKLQSPPTPTAIFIMGPTASGKTALTKELYQYLPIEIISVDSAMIYRGMDIGTAKPTVDELVNIPYRLINIRDPDELYSVVNFRQDAIEEMVKITALGRIPLLVGGTMFYFKNLLQGLSPLLPPTDYHVRRKIKSEAEKVGWQEMYQHLKNIDPKAANKIHHNDIQRILRALEIWSISGKTITELTNTSGDYLAYRIHQFAVVPCERAWLHQRIEERFHQMLSDGFINEVKIMFASGDLNQDMQSMRCIGYRQIWSYLSGEINYNEMVYRIILATKQLAKRQMTWLRRWQNVNWLNSYECATSNIKKILKIYRSNNSVLK